MEVRGLSSEVVMTVSTPAAPLTPTGSLRTGLVATRRQFLGANLSSIAAMGIVVLGMAGWVFDTMWIYSEPALLGEQGHVLGPVFVLLAVLILIASPGRITPRRVEGSLMRALASGPEFRRRVHSELHGSEVYKARRYLPSVVVLGVLWATCAVAYYVLFRDAWTDPEVTVHSGAWVAAGLIGAGVASVLLMLPGRSPRTVMVDDEGRFFTDASQPQAQPEPPAPVTAVSPAPQPVEPVAAVPQPVPPVPAAPTSGRGRAAIGAVVGVLVTVLVVVGAVAFFALRGGEARSPSEVADLFGQARVKCLDFDVINDSTSTKTLGCRSDDAQLITVTTYGNVPAADEWLTDRCQVAEGSAARLQRGYYLVGEDFIVDMHQMRHPKFVTPTPMDRTATRLARVLDAAAIPYNCNAAR